MPKGKMDINQNFEMLKAQMQAKRKKAEAQSKVIENEKVNDIVQNEDDAVVKETKPQNEPKKEKKKSQKAKATKKPEKDVVKEAVVETTTVKVEPIVEEKVSREEVVKKEKVTEQPIMEPEIIIDDSDEDIVEEVVEPIVTEREEKSQAVKITIKKIEKPEAPKRATYYLMTDTIKKIEKISKITGMGKSKLVQTLLDQALANLEIEK